MIYFAQDFSGSRIIPPLDLRAASVTELTTNESPSSWSGNRLDNHASSFFTVDIERMALRYGLKRRERCID